MTLKEFLTGLLTVTVGMDETTAAALLNADGTTLIDNALSTVLEKDKLRIKAIKDLHALEVTKSDDLGYKRAQKELMGKLETDLKTEYGLTSVKTGLDLIKEVVTAEGKKSGIELTDDKVLKHPLYLKLQDKKTADETALKADYDKKIQAKDVEFKAKESSAFVKKELRRLFDETNPVLPEDAKIAEQQYNLFERSFLGSYDWQIDGEGNDARIIPLKKSDGKPLTDDHEKRVDFGQLVKTETTSSFQIKASDPKKAPKPPGGGGGGADPKEKLYPKLNLKVPTTKEEYVKGIETIRADVSLSAEDKTTAGIQFTTDWTASQQKP